MPKQAGNLVTSVQAKYIVLAQNVRRYSAVMKRILIISVAIGLTVTRVIGAEKWLRTESPNFEVFTTGDADSATGVLRRFEQMRTLFLSSSGGIGISPIPVRIMMFSGSKEYERYGPAHTGGFYQATTERD